jgi:eukaryotic-like serine/threonine-protein kinase
VVAKPSKIGKYDVIEVLGRGGMGVVYKATDPHLNRLVAIKMMTGAFSDNPDLLKRFYREAQSTANLQHPNIVTVYDLGDLEGNPYLVMEYLEGETLDAVINSRSALTLLAKINFICDVCQGLAYAHHNGIVHRDIKPGNVMVLKSGGIKIVDFGIAHIGDKTVTRTGQLIGSLGYMSPEQVNGKPIDTRTDIFSTGVVLYQLLTYALPFDGDSTAATLLKIIHDAPPPLSKYITDCPSELQGVILRALAKDREERYRTVEDLSFDLAQIRDRLKEGMVEGHLQEAQSLLSGGFTHKARELLLQVLKIDRQHTGAIRLFRTVQQSIEQEQIGVQIKQLRSQAEEAYGNQQFEAALVYVDKALNLHQTDTGLQSLKADIQQAKARAEEVQNLLTRAEAAHQDGDLDVAKKVLEETLELAPNDLQAKALFRVIHREWEERSRRAQVDSLVESARKEIASRRFTAALNVLKEAEALDPNAPEVKSLLESATAGRAQERNRKELESINQQIEEALDRDDFVTASRTIDQGLLKFPEDRTLLKLKVLAEKQRQVSERKQFIDERLAQARTLLQAGRNEEVLKLLEVALQKVGSDPHLQSLQVIVRETVERERAEKRKGELLQRAKECLRRKEFPEAISTLEAATAEFQHDADLEELLEFAQEEAAVDQKRKAVEAVVEKARGLIENDEYEQAVQLLENELPQGHEEELGIALAQARQGATEHQKRLENALAAARKLLQNRKAADAVKFLESQPSSFRRNSACDELLQQARRDAGRWQNIENTIEQSRQLSARGKFDEAFRLLEDCKTTWGDAPELESAKTEIQARRSADATEKLELVMADGRMLLMAKEYRAVIDRLKPAMVLASVAPAKLRTEFENLRAKAGAALVQQRRTQIEQLLRKGEHLEASDLLRGSQTEFPDDRSLSELKKKLDESVARRTEVQNLLNTARRFFAESSWQQGGEACVRAVTLAALDPWLREQAIQVALRAADLALEKDWRSAETLVHELTEARAGTAVPASLRARIAEKKREQAVQDAIAEARRLQTSGDLPRAQKVVETNLASFAGDPSLQALQAEFQQLQREQEERVRLEQEKALRLEYLKTVAAQLDREPGLEARTRILEEALHKYPDEAPLQPRLADLQELAQRLAASTQKAKKLEESRQYAQAIKVWQEIKSLDPGGSEAEVCLERLRELLQKELAARKAALIEQAQTALAAYNLERTGELLTQAKAEFPTDPDILLVERALDERANARANALRLVAGGQELFEKKKWDQGGASIQSAAESARADLLVRQKAVSAMLQAAESALLLEWQSAEILAGRVAQLDPSSPELTKIRASLERRKRESAINGHLLSVQTLESAGDLNSALSQLATALAAYPDESQFLQRKQVLEAQLRAAEEAREREKRISDHEASVQHLHSAGDPQGSLARVQQGLAEFPAEARLLRLKSVVEKSIGEAEALKRREQERKRQEEERAQQEQERRRQEEQRRREEEERQRLRAEKAAAEAEKRRQEEEAEKLRLQQARQRQEEERQQLKAEKAAREAEKKRQAEEAEQLRLEAKQREEEARRKAKAAKLRDRESLKSQASAAAESQPMPVPLWKRPAALAIGVIALVTVWGGVHFISTRRQEEAARTAAPRTGVLTPKVNPLELQQRQALNQADKMRVAGDLAGASRVLQDAAALNGPLTGDVQKMQSAIEAESKDDQLRKLRQQEAQLWQGATSDVDRGQFRTAEKELNRILTLPEGGIRRDDAQKYLSQVIPQRMHEEGLLTQARQAAQKNDQNSLTNAVSLLDQVIALEGPRKPDAEQLRQQVSAKLATLTSQQQQIADLEAGAQQDLSQGDLSSARHKADQIKQAGGDPASLSANIVQAEKLEQARQQYENGYQQTVQKYQQSEAANDKRGLESARTSFQAIAQGNGSHATDARGYLSQIDAKLSDLNQPPPPTETAKPEAPSTRDLDEAAIRGVIKKYEQAFEQRNANALVEIWPTIGKRYSRYKESFDQASAFHVQVRIETVAIGQNGSQAIVNALMSVDYTPKKGNTTVPHREDRAIFELTKSNGNWVLADVR